MQISAEMRWFWPRSAPAGLEDWFRSPDSHDGCLAGGGGEVHVHRYLRNAGQGDLGLKYRGSDDRKGIEVKGLVSVSWTGVNAGPFVGPVELWTKWSSKGVELQPDLLLAVQKQRWLRKFDTSGPVPTEIPLGPDEKPLNGAALPVLGCNVELTSITVAPDQKWWTMGFESFGHINSIEDGLRAVAAVLAMRQPPVFDGGLLASYPAWIKAQIPASDGK